MTPKYKLKDWITDGRGMSGHVTRVRTTVTLRRVFIEYKTEDGFINEADVRVCKQYTWMDALAFRIKEDVGIDWVNTRQLCKGLGYSYGYQNIFKKKLYELQKAGLLRMRTKGSKKKVSVREWKLVNPELRR
jgi:hypothetical protein